MSSAVAILTMMGGSSAVADPVIVAAGDIACPNRPCDGHRQTARLIGRIDPRAVLALGDNRYPDGALADFKSSYDPTWGRFLRITHPVPGNHDYHLSRAHGYFAYFGKRAHPRHGGYYSFEVGRWHLVAINTGKAKPSRRQLTWIRTPIAPDAPPERPGQRSARGVA